MKNKLQNPAHIFTHLLLFFAFLSSCSAFPVAISTDNMSRSEARQAVLMSMSGDTDGLLVLGLLIFLIIVMPIYLALRSRFLKKK